jgi:hypothetical protein
MAGLREHVDETFRVPEKVTSFFFSVADRVLACHGGFCSRELTHSCAKRSCKRCASSPQGAAQIATAGQGRAGQGRAGRARCWSRFHSERHATVLPTGGDAKCRDSGETAELNWNWVRVLAA